MSGRSWFAAICVLMAGCSAPHIVTSPPASAGVEGSAAPPEAPLIVLDPGHTPQSGGATSVRGTLEVGYNDRFVAELEPALRAAGWRVHVTRRPDQAMSLVGRAEVANDLHAALFLSVHHDSVQLRCLKSVNVGGRTAYQTLQPMEGYSLYVSKENPDFSQSYRLAIGLGEQLRALGRAPLLVHAGKTCGEGRPLLDAHLGIYQYDRLAVLRHSKVPAVLLEVGVITDLGDEAYVDDPGNRQRMITAIVRALGGYL